MRRKNRRVHMFVDEKFHKKFEKAKKKFKRKTSMNKLATTDFSRLLAEGKVGIDIFGNGNKKNSRKKRRYK